MANEYGRVQDSKLISNFELLHYHEWEQGRDPACAIREMEFSFFNPPCLHLGGAEARKLGNRTLNGI
jgi:hypothetical protein